MSVPVMYRISENMQMVVGRRAGSTRLIFNAITLRLQGRIRNTIWVKIYNGIDPLIIGDR